MERVTTTGPHKFLCQCINNEKTRSSRDDYSADVQSPPSGPRSVGTPVSDKRMSVTFLLIPAPPPSPTERFPNHHLSERLWRKVRHLIQHTPKLYSGPTIQSRPCWLQAGFGQVDQKILMILHFSYSTSINDSLTIELNYLLT